MTSSALQIYATYVNSDTFTFPDLLNVAGLTIEDAAYDSENIRAIERIDTECVTNFGPLLDKVLTVTQPRRGKKVSSP